MGVKRDPCVTDPSVSQRRRTTGKDHKGVTVRGSERRTQSLPSYHNGVRPPGTRFQKVLGILVEPLLSRHVCVGVPPVYWDPSSLRRSLRS